MSTTQALGDPMGMRPSIRRPFTPAGSIGVHPLSDGREAWCIWLHHTQTHVNIVVWIPGTDEFETVQNVVRVQAAPVSERLMQMMES